MTKQTPWLSKSRLLTGIQCPKALYLQVHRPDLAAPVTASQQAIFDQGNEVGLAARQRFPNGVEIADIALGNALAATQRALADGANTLYEATFLNDDVLVRVDILHRPNSQSPWHLVEVKSSTSVKDQHVTDVAIQSLVASGCGIEVERASVMHLNSGCVWPNDDGLFTTVDVGDRIDEVGSDLPTTIRELKAVLARPEPPEHDLGPHCNAPYPCRFKGHCWTSVPTPSVFDLPNFAVKAWEYYSQGVVRLDDPRIEPFEGTRAHQARAALAGSRWVDVERIRLRLKDWVWPLYFLDFETIGYAIPRIAGTRPYQQVPFQFSCHYQSAPGSPLVHHEFLHTDASDPRYGITEALVRAIGPNGSIVAYNKAFEAGCIRDLAATSPEHAATLENLASRLVDPLPIIREAVYDHAFGGSFSLKAVAPALLGDRASYAKLEVGDGGAAQRAFVAMIDEPASSVEKTRLREALLAYCKQDTQVMADLVSWLYERSAN